MSKRTKYHVGIVIDKLTNSIVNTISGDSFDTIVDKFSKSDLKIVSKKNGWLFSWQSEFKLTDREMFKLTIKIQSDYHTGDCKRQRLF